MPPPRSSTTTSTHLTPDQKRDIAAARESLPYAIRPGAKTLIIGPGGGWDVARALASRQPRRDRRSRSIRSSPTPMMQERFPQLSRNLYLRPEVHVHVEDGRSFVRRSTEKYQVIQATLVDTWASTAAGAFALSENNLYTTDAFRDYLSHLTDDGLMVFTPLGIRAAAGIAAPHLARHGGARATGRERSRRAT